MRKQTQPASATYTASPIRTHRGNPLLEALPPNLPLEGLLSWFRRVPPATEVRLDRDLDAESRIQLACSLKGAHIPLHLSVKVFNKLNRLLRQGYVDRNPVSTAYVRETEEAVKDFADSWDQPLPPIARPTGLAIIGHSGVGKTTSVRESLAYFPQVIRHSEYDGNPFTMDQIVWMHIECPSSDSLRALCSSIVDAVDGALGNRRAFRKLYIKSRTSAEDLVGMVPHIFALHGVGMLVVDEIQNLAAQRSGGWQRILNFFVRFSNELGVPVVFVGTEAAAQFLLGSFRTARRLSTFGSIQWEPLEYVPGSPECAFTEFCMGIWGSQYVRSPTELTPDHLEVLHAHSEGITSQVMSLFILSQIRAIETGLEYLSPDVIDSVGGGSEFPHIQPGLEGIRDRDGTAGRVVDDIAASGIYRRLSDARKNRLNDGRKKPPKKAKPGSKAKPSSNGKAESKDKRGPKDKPGPKGKPGSMGTDLSPPAPPSSPPPEESDE